MSHICHKLSQFVTNVSHNQFYVLWHFCDICVTCCDMVVSCVAVYEILEIGICFNDMKAHCPFIVSLFHQQYEATYIVIWVLSLCIGKVVTKAFYCACRSFDQPTIIVLTM